MQSGSLSSDECLKGLTHLQSLGDGLLTSLSAGGAGAQAMARQMMDFAKSLEETIDWANPASEDGDGALRWDQGFLLRAEGMTLSITDSPPSLCLNDNDPEAIQLSVTFDQGDGFCLTALSPNGERSYSVLKDGSCLDGQELDARLQQCIEELEVREPPSTRSTADSPSADPGWLQDIARVLTAGVAVAVAAAPVLSGAAGPKQPTCPVCGGEYPEGSAFCPQCGERIEQTELCSECGAQLPEGAKFCAQCGAPVHHVTVCSCGRTFAESERFCPSCGEKRP